MEIRNLIGEFFASSSVRLFDAEEKAIPSDVLRREYGAIKSFLQDEPRSGDVVAISLERGYRYVLCILACMDAGVTFLPLNIAWPQSRIDQIKELTGFSLLISAANIDGICRRTESAVPLRSARAPSPSLYIFCTSGTTGKPKGVAIPRRAYANYLRWMSGNFPMLDERSRLLLVADFTFDMALVDLALLLVKRCSLYCSRSDGDIFRLAGEIETLRIDGLTTVPRTVELLLHDTVVRKADFSSLRCLHIGGSRFSETLHRRIFERMTLIAGVYNAYGPTETAVETHLKRLTGMPEAEIRGGHVSVGSPSPGVNCRLVDAANADISKPGVTGELLIGGAQVMTGYVGDPEKTRECLVEAGGEVWFKSGDLAFFDERGDYYIVGRKDDTIKRRGCRINLADIDGYIQGLDVVRDSATIACPDAGVDNVVVSYVVVERPISEAELRRELDGVLVDYQLPDHIEFVSYFPRNDAGKVCRRSLEERFKNRSGRND